MTLDANWELSQAIYSLLDGDATLSAMIEGIFTIPTEGQSLPYIVIGDMQNRQWADLAGKGQDIRLKIDVWSHYAGHKEALAIMSRIHELLHNATPILVSYDVQFLHFEDSDITLQLDGKAYHGSMRFRSITKEKASV